MEDYRELKRADAERAASRCFLFEQFLEELLSHEPEALQFNPKAAKVIIHAHCHAKALTKISYMARLAERLPERSVTLLDTGCCGMAGGFGPLGATYPHPPQSCETPAAPAARPPPRPPRRP